MTNEISKQHDGRLRRVAPEDAITVARLLESLYAELRDGESESVPEYRLESVKTVLRDSERSFGFFALDGERAVALLMLTEGVAVFAGGVFGQITELYVDPSYRSKGIASMLVHQAARFGRSRGWKRMDVGAPHQPRWSRSLSFYESEGFVEVGPRLRLEL